MTPDKLTGLKSAGLSHCCELQSLVLQAINKMVAIGGYIGVCSIRIYYELMYLPYQIDYDDMPIDQFGIACLRGMGWKQSKGIGLTNKW